MNKLLTLCFVLSTLVVIKSNGHVSKEVIKESRHEMMYRLPRSIHNNEGAECSYKRSPWSDCDSASNTQIRTLNLRRGGSACEQTKMVTRKCKKACKYEKGQWSDCDISINTRTRIDTLKPKSDSSCQPTRTVSKKCKKVCKYSKKNTWTACDEVTGKKTKVLVLKSGDPQICEVDKKIIKPCRGKKGSKNDKAGRRKQEADADEDDDMKYEDDK